MSQAWVEGFFALWTTIGLVVSSVNLYGAIANRSRVLRSATVDGAQAFMLVDDIRREWLRVLAHVSLFVPAAVALLTPNREGPIPPRTWGQLLMLGGLLLTPMCMALNSMLDAFSRKRVLHFYQSARVKRT